jgi:hypothetical protein
VKKRNFKTLALLGMTLSFLPVHADNKKAADAEKTVQPLDPSYGNMGYKLMSEDDLKLELSAEGLKQYNSLTPEGKELARIVASQRCKGSNVCKGLNACADDKHKCAGKGECKGQSKCGFSDKNLAVKVVADKMAAKRAELKK